MSPDILHLALIGSAIVAGLCAGLVMLMGIGMAVRSERRKRENFITRAITVDHHRLDDAYLIRHHHDVLAAIARMSLVQASLKDAEGLIQRLMRLGLTDTIGRGLVRPSRFAQRSAAINLSLLDCPRSRAWLMRFFQPCKDPVVKLYLAMALIRLGDPRSLRTVINSLGCSGTWYDRIVIHLLCGTAETIESLLPELFESPNEAVHLLLAHLGEELTVPSLRGFLLRIIWTGEPALARRAAKSLERRFPANMQDDEFLLHPDPEIRTLAFRAASRFPDVDNLDRIAAFLYQPDDDPRAASTRNLAIYCLSAMLRKNPVLIQEIKRRFFAAPAEARRPLGQVLAFRIDYFLLQLADHQAEEARSIIMEIIDAGLYSDLITFLKGPMSPSVEPAVMQLVREAGAQHPGLVEELQKQAPDSVLTQLGLERAERRSAKRTEPWDSRKSFALASLFVLYVLGLPGIYAALHAHDVLALSWQANLARFIVEFNVFFAVYSLIIFAVYAALLVLSWIGIRRQFHLWQLKQRTDLYHQGLLPAISIIAPAYREESTIVQSVSSLLNLEYPDYELIVVCDGSPDRTLPLLIETFGLAKVDIPNQPVLHTRPVRGVYRSRNHPGLTVIDKDNGGKADSLNVGLNYASKAYFCGIDADSLLEPDSLLKLGSGSLDDPRFFAASGGNILPVNGCAVDCGSLQRVAAPRSLLGLFQNVEYLRAFLCGRVGWSVVDGLLIISGAFGLFHTASVRDIGGYLTASERFKKDTVGEDMELVLRLRRHLMEQKVSHVAAYAFNANCWTEVPESWRILSSQRNRWHRGLLDILFFHRRLLFNPAYGPVGLLALPYFLIFETLGPIIEATGLLMVAAAAALGLLNATVALALFVTTILLGVFISLSSLALAQYGGNRYGPGSRWALVGAAILENFGYRQALTFGRCRAFFSAMRKPQGWGTMVRKGFSQGASR